MSTTINSSNSSNISNTRNTGTGGTADTVKTAVKRIDWTRKLTSRKLWLSVASFVSLLMVALGSTEGQAGQVTAIIMAGASVISYVLAEGWADAAGAGSIDSIGVDTTVDG